jgi:hypothetical protein
VSRPRKAEGKEDITLFEPAPLLGSAGRVRDSGGITLVAGLTADSPLTTALADLEHLDIPLVVER